MYTLKFELLYRLDYHEGDPYILGLFDDVYAVDTSTDPRDYSWDYSEWDGTLFYYSDYYITYQGTTSEIPISGGSNWVFTVSVGFSVEASNVAIGVSLGVLKVPAPAAYLYISAGVIGGSAYVITTTSDFLISYSNWIEPNRPR